MIDGTAVVAEDGIDTSTEGWPARAVGTASSIDFQTEWAREHARHWVTIERIRCCHKSKEHRRESSDGEHDDGW